MATSNEEIVEWFGQQSIWIQDAVKTFYEKGEFSNIDIKRFAHECIDEASGIEKTIDLSDMDLLFRDDRKSFSLKSIADVEGVNALAQGKELRFGTSGITVVYGENGAGKSGYIRILKKLSDAKYKEDLKKNVYSHSSSKQACKVKIVCDGVEEILECNLFKDGEHEILRDIDIFDTKISTAYINDANEVAYEPWIFSLFRELANLSTLVKKQIDEYKKVFEPHVITIPEEIQETKTGIALSSINAKSTFDESFFEWGEKDEETLQQKVKEANVDAIETQISQLGNEIKQIKGIKEYFERFESFFSESFVSKISNAKKSLNDAEKEQETAKVLFGAEASEQDKASVSVSAWKSLWKDAKEYYDTLLSKNGVIKYTEEDGICPLCGQIIGSEHVHRMKTVDEYINGNVSQKVVNGRKDYLDLLKRCPQAWDQKQLKLALDSCGLSLERDQLEQCAHMIHMVSSMIHSKEIENAHVEVIDISVITKLLANLLLQKEKEKTTKENLIQDEDHKKLEEFINELKARKFASTMKTEVVGRIEYLKIAKVHDDAIRLASSNKLSTRSKALGEELLTEDYVNRFNEELRMLTRGSVRASLKQQRVSKGKIPFRIALEGALDEKASPTDIFSEGEKRVVSLAAFFAESSGRTTECPLIVDDPISSLDLKYESFVINRLVEAGKHRQVIVFTHRLSMVVGLFDKCEKKIPFSEIELLGRGANKGVPIESAHNGDKSLGKLNKLKNDNVARLRKMDEASPEFTEGVHYVCQQIRIHVEKSVEDTLLNGVVLRYRKDVQTNNRIKWLSAITEDDCKLIDEMMTKYSYYDHSMSDEMPLQEYALNEIEADIDKLIDWLEGIKKRKKEI